MYPKKNSMYPKTKPHVPPPQVVVVADMAGLGMEHMSTRLLNTVKQANVVFSDFYPETIYQRDSQFKMAPYKTLAHQRSRSK